MSIQEENTGSKTVTVRLSGYDMAVVNLTKRMYEMSQSDAIRALMIAEFQTTVTVKELLDSYSEGDDDE